MRSSRISDATDLAMLKACGALLFSADQGDFWAIYDAEFDLRFASPELEGVAPVLTCRTVDAENLQIRKDTMVRAAGFERKVYRVVNDGTGQTMLMLTQ
jgi:hypothetical protein